MPETVTVRIDLTKNLGNYNSLKLGVTRETDLKKGEAVEDAYARAWEDAETEINAKLAEAELE